MVSSIITAVSAAAVTERISLGQNGRHLGRRHIQMNFLNKNDRIPIKISLKLYPRIPTDNKPSLAQVMAWRETGDRPLLEPILTQFTEAYMRHKGRWVN